MEKVSDEGHEEHIKFDYEKERKEFEKTFEILDLSLGEYAFDKLRKGKYISGITSTHFDAFTMGIQPYLNIIDTEDTPLMEQLGEVFKAIKLDQAFLDNASGGGKNTKNYLSKRIEVVQKRVGDFLDGRS